MKSAAAFLAFLLFLLLPGRSVQAQSYDICVYGASSAGVIAAYAAAKMNKSVVLIDPGSRPGGLTSGGLGYTDIGNKFAITGIARDFYRRIGRHYGQFEQWIFEPHVAEQVFKDYLNEGHIKILYNHRLFGVRKTAGKIMDITVEESKNPSVNSNVTISAKVFIDCSYEGDLMAKAGVSYTVGREANNQYNETYNGVQLRNKHQFPDGVSPYKIPGKPESGLLWGISAHKLAAAGSGDKSVQAYNYRICLTSDPSNLKPITKPAGYNSAWYELLIRLMQAQPGKQSLKDYLKWDLMPNNKTDINNQGGFSTDMIGMNYNYPEGTYEERKKILEQHELYTKGLLWFLGHDNRVPANIREEMLQWGYPKDEYVENNHWTPQLYVRECRRMLGEYIMTQANCQGKEVVTDGIGLAAYTMDSHNCQRLVVNGMVKNEGDVQIGGFGPYPISYRSLVPRQNECTNLIVPVCLSASHIAYGSIRMEPVFMVLGQSSAVAASMAIDAKLPVQKINISQLQAKLQQDPLLNGSPAEILTDNDDSTCTQITGNWERIIRGGYGNSWFLAASENAKIQFIPHINRPGKYALYSYIPMNNDLAANTIYIINNGHKEEQISVAAPVKVAGQTSGEWVLLGHYQLPAGRKASVSILAKGENGSHAADAILWVPEE